MPNTVLSRKKMLMMLAVTFVRQMFTQWSKNKANMNVSHIKKFHQQITNSNLLSPCPEVDWGQRLYEDSSRRTLSHAGILIPPLQHLPCSEAQRFAVLRWHPRRERRTSYYLQCHQPASPAGLQVKNSIKPLVLLVMSPSVIGRKLQNKMLLSLACFWQVLTLLCCGASYTRTNPMEVSGTELHAVMCTLRLVLRLVLNSTWSWTAACPQSHVTQIVSSAYGQSLDHISISTFLCHLVLGLLQAHAVHLQT